MIIGIDPGHNIGFATWANDTLTLKTYTAIFEMFDRLELLHKEFEIIVRLEDCRKTGMYKRNIFAGAQGRKIAQNVGQVKENTKFIEEFLQSKSIPYELVAPQGKVNVKTFKLITGYKGRCSQHARDAAMIVYKYTKR